jgi:hypothetical protein
MLLLLKYKCSNTLFIFNTLANTPPTAFMSFKELPLKSSTFNTLLNLSESPINLVLSLFILREQRYNLVIVLLYLSTPLITLKYMSDLNSFIEFNSLTVLFTFKESMISL